MYENKVNFLAERLFVQERPTPSVQKAQQKE